MNDSKYNFSKVVDDSVELYSLADSNKTVYFTNFDIIGCNYFHQTLIDRTVIDIILVHFSFNIFVSDIESNMDQLNSYIEICDDLDNNSISHNTYMKANKEMFNS